MWVNECFGCNNARRYMQSSKPALPFTTKPNQTAYSLVTTTNQQTVCAVGGIKQKCFNHEGSCDKALTTLHLVPPFIYVART